MKQDHQERSPSGPVGVVLNIGGWRFCPTSPLHHLIAVDRPTLLLFAMAPQHLACRATTSLAHLSKVEPATVNAGVHLQSNDRDRSLDHLCKGFQSDLTIGLKICFCYVIMAQIKFR